MEPTRRKLLSATAAGVTTLTIAGCLGGGDGDGDGDAPTDPGAGATDEPTDTATAEETDTDATMTGEETTTGEGTTTTDGSGATVQVRSHPDLGDILVGPDGLTLYMFDQDEQGSGASTCSGGCAEAWPPLTVDGTPTAGDGVTAELTTFDREDGSTQVAANGWPLYYFASDTEPGDVTGQGVNDVWWVLGPDGTPIRSTAGGTETGGTSTTTGAGTDTTSSY